MGEIMEIYGVRATLHGEKSNQQPPHQSQRSLSKFRTHGSSHSWSGHLSFIPACNPVTYIVTPHSNTVTSSPDFSGLYTSTVQSAPALLMQHSRPTLAFKPLIPLPHIVFSPSAPSAPSPPPLAPGFLLCLLLPLPL